VRKGLDVDLAAAPGVPAATVALLRSLADQLDQLERQLRAPDARPYDRVPLTQLAQTFHTVYAVTFGGGGEVDPFDAIAGELADELARARAAAALDTPGPPVPE
jgi:predicted metal-dependent enzyme (double-stranded beta helix superfamily)